MPFIIFKVWSSISNKNENGFQIFDIVHFSFGILNHPATESCQKLEVETSETTNKKLKNLFVRTNAYRVRDVPQTQSINVLISAAHTVHSRAQICVFFARTATTANTPSLFGKLLQPIYQRRAVDLSGFKTTQKKTNDM